MKKQHYSPEQIKEIEAAFSTTKNSTLLRKYHAIFLSTQDHTNLAISKMLQMRPGTIGIYINTYQKEGLAGLIPIKPSGRPSFMSTEQEEALYVVVRDQTPHDMGFNGRYNWTAKLASAWFKREFDITYAESSMLQVLHQIGLSYSRPSYTLAKANKEKQQQFKEELNAEKKNL